MPTSYNKPPIVLHAGELVFGRGRRLLHTLLGSCVAITLWHPHKRLGGMCHFALPAAPDGSIPGEPDARYATDCVALFKKLAAERQTSLSDYQARIFGGGNMLQSARLSSAEFAEVQKSPIGDTNCSQAFSLLIAEGVKIIEADVGENGYRKVSFDPHSGKARSVFFDVAKV
ncbi:chemotaxis protein CheD [Arsukibacterium tuosuense]|uniref:Probable chemoreceptor glutamine deamidase CheD n=1 Tax=Arsukibacterium tuosuense TaxID=1323745 RepID=A0A285IFK3_9GAMM|nr:chemotaxis protein CheD [Arsukibacterium tuosuense]SNY45866.1 chemotaxis protein CheD [Arsukibacterium tuosuense]